MKRKCKYCNTEFNFKIKEVIEIDISNNKYGIPCPFCLTIKQIFYNHIPRHIKKTKREEIKWKIKKTQKKE